MPNLRQSFKYSSFRTPVGAGSAVAGTAVAGTAVAGTAVAGTAVAGCGSFVSVAHPAKSNTVTQISTMF